MRSSVKQTQKKKRLIAALALLAVALVIPQLALADHASDHPYGQFDDASIISSIETDAAGAARWAAQGRFYMEASERAAADASAARWVAQGNVYAEASERAAAADAARWAALGASHAPGNAPFCCRGCGLPALCRSCGATD